MSLTAQQLLIDARRLAGRLRDHDSAADTIITSAQAVLKDVEALKQYHEDVESLNAIAHNVPRAQLLLGIQQENRYILLLQKENKELRAALEDYQNAIELIMSKYRQQLSCVINSTKLDKNWSNLQPSQLLQKQAEKICEMAYIMNKSIQIDDENFPKQQESLTRLKTENKGLRELLQISFLNGSLKDPLVGPKLVSQSCQTEADTMANVTILSSSSVVLPGTTFVRELDTSIRSSKNCFRSSIYVSSESGVSINGNRCSEVKICQSPTSEESEDDEEVSFNTIKRGVKCLEFKCDDESVINSAVTMIDDELHRDKKQQVISNEKLMDAPNKTQINIDTQIAEIDA